MFARTINYYNTGPRPERAPDGEIKPARFFEHLAGISGISGDYHYTKDDVMAYQDLNLKIFPYIKGTSLMTVSQRFQIFAGSTEGVFYHQKIKQFWERMKDKNPVLANIKVEADKFEGLRNAIAGIISDFNIDDINYFISMSSSQRILTPTVAWARGYDFFFPSWKVSPATIDLIDSRLEEKGKQEGNPFYKFTADHTGKIKSGSPDFLLRFL